MGNYADLIKEQPDIDITAEAILDSVPDRLKHYPEPEVGDHRIYNTPLLNGDWFNIYVSQVRSVMLYIRETQPGIEPDELSFKINVFFSGELDNTLPTNVLSYLSDDIVAQEESNIIMAAFYAENIEV